MASPSFSDFFKSKKTQVWNFFKSKKTRIWALVLVLLVALFGGIFGFRYWSFLNMAPSVVAGNFNLDFKKIPYNVPSIDITFTHDLDAASITSNSVKIYPFVKGSPTLKNSNTVSLVLGEQLKIGSKYLIQLTTDIKSVRGTPLASDISYEIEAIGAVAVTKMIPTDKTDGLAKNPLFIFNIPVIPFSTLEEREKLPCPVQFTPAIPGRCTWPSGNVLEYRIDGPLQASTEYSVKIELGKEFLYPLDKPFEAKFTTTRLALSYSTLDDNGIQRFSPKVGIPLRFTAPVSAENLQKYVTLRSSSPFYGKVVSGQALPVDPSAAVIPARFESTDKNDSSSTSWIVTGTNGPLDFDKSYTLTVAKDLPPSPGNIPFEKEIGIAAVSNAFLRDVSFSRKTYTETGAEDGEMPLSYYVPPKSAIIDMYLDEDVDLSQIKNRSNENSLVRLEAKDGKSYACNLTQPIQKVPESEDSTKIVEKPNLRALRCVFTQDLPLGTDMDLVLDKSLSPGLKDSVRKNYRTPPAFEIKDFVLLSATEACMYTTTRLELSWSGIRFSPKADLRSIESNILDSNNRPLCEDRDDLVTNGLQVRLAGNSSYDLNVSPDTQDVYGERLGKEFVKKSIKTPPLRNQDQYLYFVPSKPYQTIPSDAPVVMPIQSINLDSVNVEVCSLSNEGYSAYLTNHYNENFHADCKTKTEKKVALKNLGWNISLNKIDLQADVMGEEPLGNILLVRASADDFWTHRYPEQRDFEVVYVRSNLSIMADMGSSKGIVFATSLDGKTIPSDLKFTTNNCLGLDGSSPKFNAQKQYYEWKDAGSLQSNRGSCVVTAQNDSYFGILASQNDATSNYDFGQMGGMDTMDREYVYLHTDRPIYRAGDTVHFKGILRTFATTKYVKSTAKNVKIRLLNDQGELFKEQIVKVDANSDFEGDFELTTGMQTGRYSAEVLGYEANMSPEREAGYYIVNDLSFYVEQYSKPVFKTDVHSDKKDVQPGDKVTSTAQADYYFGGAVQNAMVTWTTTAQDYYFDPKNYSQYRFGTDFSYFNCQYWGQCSYNDKVLFTTKGTLNELGQSSVDYVAQLNTDTEPQDANLAEFEKVPPKERIVSFSAEVQDPNTGKTVTGTDSSIVHITDGYVGINTQYWTDKTNPIKVNGIVLTNKSETKANADVTLQFIRQEWSAVKKMGVDGVYYQDYSLKKTLEDTQTVSSSKDGTFVYDYRPKQGGEYVVRASYSGSNKQSFVSESYSYVADDSYTMWNNGNNSVTDLIVEKSIVNPGETAVFTLKSPVKSGKVFVSVEKDDQILSAFVTDLTGYAQKIEIPVTKEHIPNIYVRAFLIGKDDEKWLPVFKRALSQVRVLADSQKLSVDVSASKPRYVPGEGLKVAISVKDADGKPVAGANGSISVVDQSVLALAGNPLKNPFAFFYEIKRYLGTTMYLSLNYLVDKLEVKNTANGEKWGAGEGNKGGDTKKKRGLFKDTAYWQANFTTDGQGNATIDTGSLPDNLTTWEIEAVVSTATTQIGAGRTTITTRKPVMINENFPRFLRTEDSTVIAPVVFNQSGKKQTFIVQVSATGATFDNSKKSVTLDDGGSAPVSFTLTANSLDPIVFTGEADIVVTATADSGEQDSVERFMQVSRSESFETTATIGATSGSSVDEKLNLAGVDRNRGKLVLSTSASLLGNTIQGIDGLLHYPYGCIEQITSAIIPHLAVKKINDALKIPYDLNVKTVKMYDPISLKMVDRTIAQVLSDYVVKVMTYRVGGGFGYWTGNRYADFRMTGYAMSALSDIASLGIPVDQSLSNGALEYLKTRLQMGTYEGCVSYGPGTCDYSTSDKIQAVEAIAKWSKDGVDALKFYRQLDQEKWSFSQKLESLAITNILLLKSGIAQSDKEALKKTATELLDKITKERLVYDPRGAYISPDGDVSRLEATARYMQAMALVGRDTGADQQILDNMSRFIAKSKKSDGSYGSTIETVRVLQAFADRVTSDKAVSNTNFVGHASLGEKQVFEGKFDFGNILDTKQTDLDLKGLPDNVSMNMSMSGTGRFYYDMTLKNPISAKDIQARDEGFFVQTEYYDFVEYQKISGLKAAEYEKYLKGDIPYSALKYPKNTSEYLKPVIGGKIGQLLWVEYRLILSESRDKVAFESFIPAGSELVNTALSTETKTVTSDTPFNREEFLDDRYFGFADVQEPGEYRGSYVIRLTQAGTYMVPSTRVFEFYAPEVFGQTRGKAIEVTK